MKKWLAAGLVALLVAFGAWYFVSPAWALKGLQDAAQAGDAAALEQRVDFPAVRQSLKTQLRARLAGEIARPEMDNPFGKMSAMLAMGMVDGMVEGLVTPQSISTMVLEGKESGATAPATNSPPPARPQAAPSKTPAADPKWEVRREGLNRFSLVSTRDPANDPELRFARRGFGWQLVEVEIKALQPAAPR